MVTRHARIVFVHGRPAPHPNRTILLPAIGAQLVPVDFILPWAASASPARWRKTLSLLLCAVRFPDRRKWDLVMSDEPQHLPVIMKMLGLLDPQQKIVPYIGSRFMYFLATGYYGRVRTALLRRSFLQWDAYVCLSPMIVELAQSVLPQNRHRDIFLIQNFIRNESMRALRDVKPDLNSQHVVFVGNGPSGDRLYYKGLDLMFDAMTLVRERVPLLRWSIVGDWDASVQSRFARSHPLLATCTTWVGHQSQLAGYFAGAALYIHCARGEAWGITVTEAMAAGLPALVSEWTGTRHLAGEVDPRLVAPLDAKVIADRAMWYLSLSSAERAELSRRAREIALCRCTQAEAISVFRARVQEIVHHLEMGPLSVAARDEV